jgi:hypothetical protein
MYNSIAVDKCHVNQTIPVRNLMRSPLSCRFATKLLDIQTTDHKTCESAVTVDWQSQTLCQPRACNSQEHYLFIG